MMSKLFRPAHSLGAILLFAFGLMAGQVPLAIAGPDTSAALALRARYAELNPQLSNSPFGRPLHLVSTETASQLKGDIYALVDYPLGGVSEAFTEPAQWCEVLILHLNTKYCQVSTGQAGSVLVVGIGKKVYQSAEDAYRVDFAFRAAATTPEYLDVGLNAKSGPLGTSDYRIQLEAVAVPGRKTFLHLTYSYTYNFAARVAMRGYLATIGRGKVGFTQTEKSDHPPEYIGGVRGVVERNTMRYYLAIDAYLGALSAPPAAQFEKRLQNWFALTERYPLQLHEVEQVDYLDMKRREYLRR